MFIIFICYTSRIYALKDMSKFYNFFNENKDNSRFIIVDILIVGLLVELFTILNCVFYYFWGNFCRKSRIVSVFS